MYDLKFNDTDLAANRQGVLSDAQRKRLDAYLETVHRYSRFMTWIFALSLGVLVLIGVVTEYQSVQGDLNQLMTGSKLSGYAIAFTTLFVCFGVIVVWNWWAANRLAQGDIVSAEGTAEVFTRYTYARGMRVPIHRVKLHQGVFRRFTLMFPTAESLKHFKQGRRYRVYYIRYASPYVLSAEEIDEKEKNDA